MDHNSHNTVCLFIHCNYGADIAISIIIYHDWSINLSMYRNTYRIVTHVARYVSYANLSKYRDTCRIVTHVSRISRGYRIVTPLLLTLLTTRMGCCWPPDGALLTTPMGRYWCPQWGAIDHPNGMLLTTPMGRYWPPQWGAVDHPNGVLLTPHWGAADHPNGALLTLLTASLGRCLPPQCRGSVHYPNGALLTTPMGRCWPWWPPLATGDCWAWYACEWANNVLPIEATIPYSGNRHESYPYGGASRFSRRRPAAAPDWDERQFGANPGAAFGWAGVASSSVLTTSSSLCQIQTAGLLTACRIQSVLGNRRCELNVGIVFGFVEFYWIHKRTTDLSAIILWVFDNSQYAVN